ncbi:hypothetical protein TVAG_238000 [Trichomonas vaginalis G3]|uniref:Sel1 repeat family protein n=2 Tax=Trichomonas vaginalis (strain ATCC PRA-98 / G3) TaxID=412133 RepID=A2DD00_TRIV3|nr:hypothetical protein TVAG_238000 [Trichomonas vaginalis G3]|eukprot:XP_001582760.1 hypothetical protein [Trichomonas vaginalis G3]
MDDPIFEFINCPMIKEEAERQESATEEKISDEKYEIIYQRLQNEKEVFGKVIMSPLNNYTGYMWEQDGDLITIKYSSPYDLVEKEIEINENSIDTQFLAGIWYDKVKQHEYKINGRQITITLQVEGFWPILIRGGNMDIHSAFQLSNYCEDIGMHEEGLILLKYSAMRYHPQAPLALAALALQKQNTQEALYWYSRCETTRTSKQLILRVAMLLLDFGTYEAFIAENLLIQLVPSGMSEALYYLGYLHMKHPGDFIGSDSLVIEYFTQAANNGNLQAMDTLGKCYLNGICVEKDVEKGTELLKKAGELAMKLIQENHEENENDEEIEEEEVPEKISKAKELLIDTSISLGIAAAVGFGTVFLFRKFFGK